MIRKRQTPPSRLGKKQVIAFLRPNQIEAAYRRAADDNLTNQEVIGMALNAVFASYGMPPLIPAGHHRIVRRSKGRAQVRKDSRGPSCRQGTLSYGGWFDAEIVDRLTGFSSETHLSIQQIIEKGIEMITGVAPAEEEDWLTVLEAGEAVKEAA